MDRQPDKARHLDAVRAVARHSHEPKKSHWKAAQKILNYLRETAHLTLKFKQDSTVDVGTLVYVDADFASKATDRNQFREHWFLWLPCVQFGFLGGRNAFHSPLLKQSIFQWVMV